MTVKNKWQTKLAVQLSSSEVSPTTLKQLLQQHDWGLHSTTPNIEEALQILREGQASVLIIEGSTALPAGVSLRTAMLDPIVVLSPVLCIINEVHQGDFNPTLRCGYTAAILQPLSSIQFDAAFSRLIKTWERREFYSVRERLKPLLKEPEQEEAFLTMIQKHASLKEVRPLIASAAALTHYHAGRVREAEGILLAQLRLGQKNWLIFLTLAHLYMHMSMPHVAFKLFHSLHQQHQNCLFIQLDLAQAKIMTEDYKEAVTYLGILLRRFYATDTIEESLCLLNMAIGSIKQAQQSLHERPGLFKKIESAWERKRLILEATTAQQKS